MASQVNPSSINAQFPVAGVSQPSQGFRSNFLAIQNAFSQYVTEANDLLNKVIVSAPLLFGANVSINNFGGMKNSNLALYDYGLVTANIPATVANSVPTLNFSNASVANINIVSGASSTQTINVSNFPGLGYSEMLLYVTATNTPQYLNLSNITPGGTLKTSGGTGIAGFNSSTSNYAITTTNPYTLKLSSTDGVNYILSAPSTAVAKNQTPSGIGSVGDTAGMIAYDSGFIYVCTGNYNGSTVIWKKAAIS